MKSLPVTTTVWLDTVNEKIISVNEGHCVLGYIEIDDQGVWCFEGGEFYIYSFQLKEIAMLCDTLNGVVV